MKAFWILAFLLIGATVAGASIPGNMMQIPSAPKAETKCDDILTLTMVPCIIRGGYYWCSHGPIKESSDGS